MKLFRMNGKIHKLAKVGRLDGSGNKIPTPACDKHHFPANIFSVIVWDGSADEITCERCKKIN